MRKRVLQRGAWLLLVLLPVCGCTTTANDVLDGVIREVFLPEQRTIPIHDPAHLPPTRIPPIGPPRTVSDPQPQTPEWHLSLDEAIHIALQNGKVVRVLTGQSASSTGATIYDPAISNTAVDQERATFDPNLSQDNTWLHTDIPQGIIDPLTFSGARILGTQTDAYQSVFGLDKTNVLGGQWALNWTENPMRFSGFGFFPLNPQNRDNLELRYTQPLLQGGGLAVNKAPIVIATIDTERSFFQYKGSVQQLVRSVIEAYWNLVQSRTDVWARKIQVQQSREAYEREKARLEVGFADLGTVAQARVTYNQFRASLIDARAAVLANEGALRNLLGLTPEDGRQIIPVSAPTTQRVRPKWKALVALAEQRRPDIIELKLLVETDRLRLLQARNQSLPQLNAVALYRWNGLSGQAPGGDHLRSDHGQFTDWELGLNLSVPLGFRAARAQIRQQKLTIARDQANVEQAVHAAVHDLAASVRTLDNAFEQYQAFKETRAAALENLRVQIEQFRFGRNIYLNVLQALNDWGDAVSSEAAALLNYNVTLALLEEQTGTILETHGLVFYEERFLSEGPLGLPGHAKCYPAAVVPTGSPKRYPGTGRPAENAFDLRNPDLGLDRDEKSDGRPDNKNATPEKPRDSMLLPRPRQLPRHSGR